MLGQGYPKLRTPLVIGFVVTRFHPYRSPLVVGFDSSLSGSEQYSDDSVEMESSVSVSAALSVSINSTGARPSGALPILIRTAGFYYRKKR